MGVQWVAVGQAGELSSAFCGGVGGNIWASHFHFLRSEINYIVVLISLLVYWSMQAYAIKSSEKVIDFSLFHILHVSFIHSVNTDVQFVIISHLLSTHFFHILLVAFLNT